MALRIAQNAPAKRWLWLGLLVTSLLVLVVVCWKLAFSGLAPAPAETAPPRSGKVGPDLVRVAPDQAAALDVGPANQKVFSNLRQTIGNIDFNQDRTIPVYTTYQGRISRIMVKAGDDVKAGQVLYTVNLPDVAQAASTLISTAGALRASNETLRRAQVLAQDDSIPQKEFEQNRSDQQAAEAAYNAARKTVSLFGLSTTEIAAIEREHRIDVEMPVKSPITGRVTARAAQVGLLVQPGTAPAPITVADMHTLWMVASVPESDFGLYRVGQPVSVRVQAWPGKTFSGTVSYVGDAIDANTRRLVVRADVVDSGHLLRPQMLADFSFTLGAPESSLAVPAAAVVRESSGVTAVWVAATGDGAGPRFTRRTVTIGRSEEGMVQINAGLNSGEQVVRKNALFLSNLYETGAD